MTSGCLRAIQALHIYGAAGIVAFGWTLARLLDFRCAVFAPLWFAGALFVYNIDRLKLDRADAINTPRRLEQTGRLRKAGIAITALSGLALVVIPLLAGDWLMLALTVSGGVACLSYSIPFAGLRLKDVPLLKSFFAPTLLAFAYFLPPWIEQGLRVSAVHFVAVYAWSWSVLFFNMLLCDLRDIEGDRASGTVSVPVFLGASATLRALAILLAVIVGLSFAVISSAPRASWSEWKWICALTPFYLAGLLAAMRKVRSESFYEWWVEGILFVPPAVWLFAKATVMP